MAKTKEPENRHCGLCEHSICSVLWGEYKCALKKRYVPNPDQEAKTCPDFKDRGTAEQRVSKESRDDV